MRMRKKRHLEERLRSCEDVLIVKERPMLNLKVAQESFRALFSFSSLFQNENPVRLEIGCGCGNFLLELAKREEKTNFLGVEMCSNVLLAAMEKIKAANLKNVKFLNIPAEILPCYIPEGSVERIYLNFSTPLPEKSREKQRLTSERFLKIYQKLLKPNGCIEQKTDSAPFFEYSLENFQKFGFEVREVTKDLHASEYEKDNIVTEYERNFVEKGLPIFRAVAVLR